MGQLILVARSLFAPVVIAFAHKYRLPARGSEASRTIADAACIVLMSCYLAPGGPLVGAQIMAAESFRSRFHH